MVAEPKPRAKQAKPRREPVITVAKMTSKGQITVPKFVRDHFRFKAGDEVVFVEDEHGMHVRRTSSKLKHVKKWQAHFKDLRGRSSDEIIDDWRGH